MNRHDPERVEQSEIARCIDAVLRARRSVRAYRAEPVSWHLVRDILQAAGTAPSNSNTQPWRVYVLCGAPKLALSEALLEALQRNELPPSPHFPDQLPPQMAERQADFAERYYGCLGIERDDAASRARQSQRNYRFFDAPVGLIFTIDARLARHSWLDLGLFVQNVMIAAKARGLDTCPQVSFARFHPVLADHLQFGENEITACGMSMGYADVQAAVNGFDMPRQPVEAFSRALGFD